MPVGDCQCGPGARQQCAGGHPELAQANVASSESRSLEAAKVTRDVNLASSSNAEQWNVIKAKGVVSKNDFDNAKANYRIRRRQNTQQALAAIDQMDRPR